jgi:hypothetical protein
MPERFLSMTCVSDRRPTARRADVCVNLGSPIFFMSVMIGSQYSSKYMRYMTYVLRCHTPDSQSHRERRVTCHEKEVRGERLVRGRRGAGGGARGRARRHRRCGRCGRRRTRNYAKAQPQRAHQEGLYGYGRARGPTHED